MLAGSDGNDFSVQLASIAWGYLPALRTVRVVLLDTAELRKRCPPAARNASLVDPE
jgi:hypothetical protein